MTTSIVILTHNNLSLTKACIQSIEEHTDDYELIIVDNGSTDGTVEYIQSLPNTKYLFNEENAGYSKGCNQGAALATGEYILFLNNDTLVTSNWLTDMLSLFEKDSHIAMVGPVSNNISGVQRVAGPLGESDRTCENDFFYSYRLVGFCLLIKHSIFKEVGCFDEQFGVGSCEDDDYCYRVLEKGYRLAVAKNVYIHHVGHASFTTNETDRVEIQNENMKKLYSKWGVNYFPYMDSRVRLHSFMRVLPDSALKILDVGCGIGTLGIELLNRNKEITLWGVEDNPLLKKLASPYYEKVVSEDDLATLHEHFDAIIIQSSSILEEQKIVNALQWRKVPTEAVGLTVPKENTRVYLYLTDIKYQNALPIIKPIESSEALQIDYLQKIKHLFSLDTYELDTMLKKSIKPQQEAIIMLSRLITEIEATGSSGDVVSDWRLESNDEFKQFVPYFDQVFYYDTIIEITHKGQSEMESTERQVETSYV